MFLEEFGHFGDGEGVAVDCVVYSAGEARLRDEETCYGSGSEGFFGRRWELGEEV